MEYKGLGDPFKTDLLALYNCDCMELLKQTPDKYYSLCIVDPPYGIGFDGEVLSMVGKYGKNYTRKSWDSCAPNQEYFDELFRVSKNQIIWGANHFISKINKDSSCWVVWDKQKGDFSLASCELAWTSFKTAVRMFTYQWHGFLQGGKKEERSHPTQKPVALYKWLLHNYAKPGDKILDTHLGSGSIAIACHQIGFDLTGSELDKDYFEAMQKRIKYETAQEDLFG